MAYATTNPPVLVIEGGMNGQNKIWFYRSVDAATLVRVAGYFTNGYDLGMRSGDLLIQVDTDASPLAMQLLIVNAATASGGVDVSDGLAVTATDTD